MFQKILIANRGEIAVRIERTLKKMGIASVAVYADADKDSMHVDHADEAVYLGEGSVSDTYLNMDKIIQAALSTGADAIHPGYGFLSENIGFAEECEKHGITFIGPTKEQIKRFGLKHLSRQTAREAGVPLLPGSGLLENAEMAAKEAEEIGYPVILKSTAGGGGIGMRVCKNEEEVRTFFNSVQNLAGKNFGDDGVFAEKFVERARHIEVQIFGNKMGETVAFTERDCSIQRRNQKVVEESPAPRFCDKTRKEIQAAALRLASSIGYQSAGTVEFLYDEETEKFYFLEVNTRLQVEHGITEEIHGIDLVEWMILEAAGELTHLAEKMTEPTGHAIEVRIYAEDCLNDFRPCTGKVDAIKWPNQTRIESFIRDGMEIPSMYDPMIAKLIVHGNTREETTVAMQKALHTMRIYGITTNRLYLEKLFSQDTFREGKVFTGLLLKFASKKPAIEVIDGGIQSTVQDYPGRIGHWDVGVPPCGPMDDYSFRLGNAILHNNINAAGLEMTLRGGSYRFRGAMAVCITGADMQPRLNGKEVPMYERLEVQAGDKLTFGEAKTGMRTYLTFEGGLDMPLILGSASTFTLGNFGGHNGRALRLGDVLCVCEENDWTEKDDRIEKVERTEGARQTEGLHHRFTNEWTIGVVIGPHSTEEFVKPTYIKHLSEAVYKVSFNSARTGIRLNGPVPEWTRTDGGEAGLHPSNIHDNAYAVGAMDLTGDQSIMLGPDGPSLGGFICPVVTASSELWKIGQLHPGDSVHFEIVSMSQARTLRKEQEKLLQMVYQDECPASLEQTMVTEKNPNPQAAILYHSGSGEEEMTIRASGDEYLLLEYGEMELNIKLRFRVHVHYY